MDSRSRRRARLAWAGATPAKASSCQRGLAVISRDLERTTLEARRPEVIGIQGLESKVFRVPSGGLSPVGYRDVYMVEASHSKLWPLGGHDSTICLGGKRCTTRYLHELATNEMDDPRLRLRR